MKLTLIKFTAFLAIMAMVSLLYPPASFVRAAALTNLNDVLSTIADSDGSGAVLADHTIQWDAPSGVASTETIVITFPASFDGTIDGLDFNDVDFLVDTIPDQVCDGSAQDLVTSSPSSSQWSAVFSGTEGRILTLTSGGVSATVGTADEVCIQIGENATGGAANSQYENPDTTGSYTVTVTSGSSDSGSFVIDIVDDDSVAVTATVDPSLTFTIGDVAIGFGTLVTANARFASADANGTDGPTSASAHDMTVATNATSGYTITYNGSTLTSGGDTITVATIAGDEGGTPDSEQFAIGFVTDGNATITTAYDQESPTFKYTFVAGTTTAIITESGPTATETFTAFYLANIGGSTEAGSYSTSITYIATSNF